jgi:hypothetical protein
MMRLLRRMQRGGLGGGVASAVKVRKETRLELLLFAINVLL